MRLPYHYGLPGVAHKATNPAAARKALDAPQPDPVVVESVAAFMERVAGIEWMNCPYCREGQFRVVEPLPPSREQENNWGVHSHLPRAPPGETS